MKTKSVIAASIFLFMLPWGCASEKYPAAVRPITPPHHRTELKALPEKEMRAIKFDSIQEVEDQVYSLGVDAGYSPFRIFRKEKSAIFTFGDDIKVAIYEDQDTFVYVFKKGSAEAVHVESFGQLRRLVAQYPNPERKE